MGLIILPSAERTRRAPTALAVGVLDTVGHRGLSVDLRTFGALGVHGASAATAVSTAGPDEPAALAPLPAAAVTAALLATCRSIPIDAVKLGALVSAAVVVAAVEALDEAALARPIVLDPELSHEGGSIDAPRRLGRAIAERLLKRVHLVTVDPEEAALLTGRPVEGMAQLRDAARALFDLGVRWPIVKATGLDRHAVNLVFDGQGFIEFGGDRIGDRPVAGAGALLSAAITAELACGAQPLDAVDRARRLVVAAIQRPLALGDARAVNPLVLLHESARIDPNRVEIEPERGAGAPGPSGPPR